MHGPLEQSQGVDLKNNASDRPSEDPSLPTLEGLHHQIQMLTNLVQTALKQAVPAGPYLTHQEAAVYTRLSTSYLYQLAREGQLRPSKIGSRVVFHKADLDRYIAVTRAARKTKNKVAV